MKKIIVLLCLLMIIVGCSIQKEDINKEDNLFVLEKIDDSKEYVYIEEYKNLKYKDGTEYQLNNIVINIKSDMVDNVNLELNNFVVNSYDSMSLTKDVINYGNIIDYDYYVTDNYVSVIQKYGFYINGNMEEEDSNIYVVSLDSGKLMDNNDILREFEYSEERLFNYLDEYIDSDDKEFSLMQIKNNGYKLFVNDTREIVISYNELLNDKTIRKELVVH